MSGVVERLRRHPGLAGSAAVAALAVLGVVALIVSLERSPTSSSRLVTSSAGTPTSTSPGATAGPGGPGGPGGTASTGSAPAGTATGSTGAVSPPLPPAIPATTTPATGITVVTSPSTTTKATAPAVTTPSTTPPAGAVVQGTVLFSPTCPVERMPPDPACAPKPGPAHIQLLRSDGSVAAEGDANRDSGQFSIPVAPGTYAVRASATSVGRGCVPNPTQVTITAKAGTTIAVSCDTGIR